MRKIEATLKRKSTKKPLIILISIISAAVIILLSFFIIQKGNLDRALKNLDIEDEQTVIRAMKYGGKKNDVVLDIAQRYLEADMTTDCARLCIYAIEYLDAEDEAYSILEKCGTDSSYYSQFKDGDIPLSEFEIITAEGNDGYGIADGIYTSFLGGYAKAKISAIIPIDIYAFESGAYFLDSTDRLIKSISRDGSDLQVIVSEKAEEFIYCGRQIYYIDQSGQPHGKEEITLAEGEFARGLYTEGEKVRCTVYNKSYESVRELTLN